MNESQRNHLKKGIYRKKIDAAYFDATRARMNSEECVREAIAAGGLTLLGNRSAELRGLTREALAAAVWDRIRPAVATLHQMDFETRRKHVVGVVARCLADAAFEFWITSERELT